MNRRKSRWAVRREKSVLGDLAEWPLSTTYDIAERLRLDPDQIARALDALLAERRIRDHWISVPALFGNRTNVCHWALPGFDTALDTLTADQPDKEHP